LADFNNFWHTTSGKNLMQMTSFGHLTLILSLHYLVKCRSRIWSFTTMNSCWIAYALAQKWLTEKQQTRLQLLYLKKSHMSHHNVFITAGAQNVLFQCKCKRQMSTPITKRRLNNLHFTR